MVTNLKCLIKACQNKHIDFIIIDPALIRINVNQKYYYFFLCQTPLNSQDVVKIAKDKAYTYVILNKFVKQPKTIIFFNPDVKPSYKKYVTVSLYELALLLDQWESKKFVVKMNQGKRKKNVFFCTNIQMVFDALKQIFNPNSKDYDYIAIIQEWINIKAEYRIICLDRNITFAYNKRDFSLINDNKLIQKFNHFIQPIFNHIDIKYCGIDVAMDQSDVLYLLEINTAPGFTALVKSNKSNKKIVIELYSKILDYIKSPMFYFY